MQTSVKKLTNDHETWKSTLAFYKDEILVFRNRLNEIAERNNTHPILEKIEQYQNKLDIHNEKMSELKHEIDSYVHHVAVESQNHSGHVAKETAEKFEQLKEKTELATNLFEEFKTEFKRYIEKVL
jgi:CO dehydrogenase/acetyl-CoA synthase alpha subunit